MYYSLTELNVVRRKEMTRVDKISYCLLHKRCSKSKE